MADVFADLSEDALNRVSEENFFASLTCFSILPDVEVYQGEDMIRVVSPGIPNGLTNAVCRCRLSAENVDNVIDETHDYFYSKGVVPNWQLCLTDLPIDLAQRLANMDQLKSQFIATVSHDLKQLLSAMSGYIELLTMMSKLEARERHYVDMVQRSIHNMRQLIDDLLDLAKKGLVPQADCMAMTVDLKKLNEAITILDGLRIERVTDAATMREKHGWIRRLGTGRTLGTLLMDLFTAYGFDPDSDWQHYIALLDGEPVSWASVFYATGVAGIYAVGTLPEARRQGIGAAITLQGLLDARERGYRVGVLQSSEMGYNVYRRLGFEPRFIIRTFAPAESQA